MNSPIFLSPLFMDRIWGGTKLKSFFNYNIPSDTVGECWGISAHTNGDCVILNGNYKGKTLYYLWDNHRDLFGNIKGDKFPLLTKILDSNDNLSVQVHPDDKYAFINENGELGKTECWYVIDCDDDAEIILGHNATTKEELTAMIHNNQWDSLLKRIKVKKGDFFYVPSGAIHALCKGSLILETQQNSDTTYRVYDYNRTDSNGNTRELHLDKSIDVIQVPHNDLTTADFKIDKGENYTCTTFISNDFFSVYKLDTEGLSKFNHNKDFSLYSVIDGEGTIICEDITYPLNKGDHFILPHNIKYFEIDGNLEVIVSTI